MTINYAYLDAEGYVRQWSKGASPSAVEGFTLHQLLPGENIHEYLRMVDGALVQYQPDVLIEDARAGAIADANAARDRRMAAFDRFTYNGILYDGDARAEARIALAAARAAQDGAADVMWRAFNNADTMLSPGQVIAMQAALIEAKASRAAFLHEACCALKQLIAVASTADAIRAAVAASAISQAQEGTV